MTMSEQRNYNKKNDRNGYKNNKGRKSNNNQRYGQRKKYNNNEEEEIMSYKPKPRKEKASKKTIEVKDP